MVVLEAQLENYIEIKKISVDKKRICGIICPLIRTRRNLVPKQEKLGSRRKLEQK